MSDVKDNKKVKKVDHSTRAHARLGASSSAQWLACPGSIQMQEQYYDFNPDAAAEEDRSAANEGEFAHEVADWCIKNDISPLKPECKEHFAKINDCNYNLDEVIVNVEKYFGYVGSIMQKAGSYDRYLEVRVDFSEWVTDGFGTLDLGFVSKDSMYVFDLKYGRWKVHAHENTQLMLYALGLYAQLSPAKQANIRNFHLSICQPRISYFGNYSIHKNELMDFGSYAREGSKLALSKDPPLVPGVKQCKWCAAKSICPAVGDY